MSVCAHQYRKKEGAPSSQELHININLLTGSTKTDSPGVINPFASASSISDLPRRSFTEEQGPNDSSLPNNLTPLLTVR